MKNKPMEFFAMPSHTTVVNADEGIVDAIVNVCGILDAGGVFIASGAFKKTINENGRRVRVLNNHNSHDVLSVVGRVLDIREIGRDELPAELLAAYPEATGGLWTRTQYLLDTPEGAGVFARIKAGAVAEYSIGFRAVKHEYQQMTWRNERINARVIKEVALWEYSPVIWGMNPATMTTEVKHMSDDAPSDDMSVSDDHDSSTDAREEARTEVTVQVASDVPADAEAAADTSAGNDAHADTGAEPPDMALTHKREEALREIALAMVQISEMRDV